MKITITGDIAGAQKALAEYPNLLRLNVMAALDRAAVEVASEARRLAPKAFSTLTSSIRHQSTGEFERLVAPGANYAAAVEEGTGPAVGKRRYMPDSRVLETWIRRAGVVRVAGKPGSKRRARQDHDIHNRAFLLARYIEQHGTKPQPYMAPAAANKDSRVKQLLATAVLNANQGAFGV